MTTRHSAAPALDGHGLNSVSLEQLAAELSRLGEEVFRSRYACAFLVLQHGPDQWRAWLDLKTSEASIQLPKKPAGRLVVVSIIPLVKSDRNAYRTKITAGRALNNDVIIRSTKVSKLHSTFYRKDKNEYLLEDMGSLNGTVVNGMRLKEKEKVRIENNDLISFWHYLFEFVHMDDMIEAIKEHSSS